MSASQRKYHAAAGFSRQQRQRLDRLGEHVSALDQELARVEAMIQERFPALGLMDEPSGSDLSNVNVSDEVGTVGTSLRVRPRHHRRKPR